MRGALCRLAAGVSIVALIDWTTKALALYLDVPIVFNPGDLILSPMMVITQHTVLTLCIVLLAYGGSTSPFYREHPELMQVVRCVEVAGACYLGGTVGNLVELQVYHRATDFIPFMGYMMNVADMCIFFALPGFLLTYVTLFSARMSISFNSIVYCPYGSCYLVPLALLIKFDILGRDSYVQGHHLTAAAWDTLLWSASILAATIIWHMILSCIVGTMNNRLYTEKSN